MVDCVLSLRRTSLCLRLVWSVRWETWTETPVTNLRELIFAKSGECCDELDVDRDDCDSQRGPGLSLMAPLAMCLLVFFPFLQSCGLIFLEILRFHFCLCCNCFMKNKFCNRQNGLWITLDFKDPVPTFSLIIVWTLFYPLEKRTKHIALWTIFSNRKCWCLFVILDQMDSLPCGFLPAATVDQPDQHVFNSSGNHSTQRKPMQTQGDYLKAWEAWCNERKNVKDQTKRPHGPDFCPCEFDVSSLICSLSLLPMYCLWSW